MKKFEKTLSILLVCSIMMTPVKALTKNETVYSKLNTDGSVKKTIVSEYLKNSEDKIEDQTNLKNILNLNGNEKFKIEGSNIIWDAKGKDIYYQGETDKKLPVETKVTYKLNGKEIALKDLLGKKGKVEITLKYVNIDKHIQNINGKDEELYTPFLVTVGTIIKNSGNTNIEVTNGKVVSNGKNSVIIAIASPGLYESLGLDSLKDIDTVKITYDTKKFELSSIYSVVSSKLIEENDLKIFDKLDRVYDKVNTLSLSSKKIVEGASNLYNGTLQFQNGLNKSINSTEPVLTEEQKAKVLNSTLEIVNSKFTDEYKDAIGKEAVKVLNETDEMKTKIDALNATGSQDVGGMTFDELATTCTSGNTPTVLQATCSSQNANITTYLTNKALIKKMQEIAYSTAIKTSEETAKSTTKELVPTLSEKVASETKTNTLKIVSSNMTKLVDGAKTLSEGVNSFDNEGIKKIDSLVNGDIKTKVERLKKLVKLGSTYDTFTMKDKNTDGETKFILIIDGAKKKNKNK